MHAKLQSEPHIPSMSPISPLSSSSGSHDDPLDELFVLSSEEEELKQQIGEIAEPFHLPYETNGAHSLEGNSNIMESEMVGNANIKESDMVEPPVSFRDGSSTHFVEVISTADSSSNSTPSWNTRRQEEQP